MSGENDGYFCRLRRFWFPDWPTGLWFLFGLMPALFFQTVIHEGWHVVFAKFKVDVFAPFPLCQKGGHIRNGLTIYDLGVHAFPAAPQIMELVMLVGLFFLLFFWPFRSRALRYVFRLWFFAVCVDFCFNTFASLFGNPRPDTDWTKFQADLKWGDGGMAVFTWILWIVFVLSHFVWVNWSRWHRNEPERATFFSYRWMAIPLFLLSMTALIFTWTVSDKRIDKGCAYAILAMVGQILSALWFVAYFIWCSARKA